MTGSISEAYYKVIPKDILCSCLDRLPLDLKADILKFFIKYPNILDEKGIEYLLIKKLIAEDIIDGKDNNFEVMKKSLIGIIDEKGQNIIINDGTKSASVEPCTNVNSGRY